MKTKLALLAVPLLLFYLLYSNVFFLSKVSCNYSNQSATYEFLIERIYKLISHDNEDDYLSYLDMEGDKSYNVNWLRILSVAGVKDINTYIFDSLNESNNNHYPDYVHHYLNNVGISGSLISIPLLKGYIDSDDSDWLSKAFSAHALYLLGGTKPSIESDYYFLISEKEFLAREVILNSRGRRRTFDEMITIDQLYRRTEIIVHEE